LKGVAGRVPADAKGEINRTPAGGSDVSVAAEAPLGRPVDDAATIDPNVTTIRPLVRYAAVPVIVEMEAFRNSSAAPSPPGVPAMHWAPAAPSGHGGWTIVSSTCGGVLAMRAASPAKVLASSADQLFNSAPAGTAWLSM